MPVGTEVITAVIIARVSKIRLYLSNVSSHNTTPLSHPPNDKDLSCVVGRDQVDRVGATFRVTLLTRALTRYLD